MPMDIEGYDLHKLEPLVLYTKCSRLGRFRSAGYQAIDRICDLYEKLEERDVTADVEPGYLRKALPGTYIRQF